MKYLFALIFFSSFFSQSILSQSNDPGVRIERSVKKNLSTGEYEISLTIYKGDLTGVGALYEVFSDGTPFLAAVMKNGGASFGVTETGVKFIWVSLPADTIISISYNVKDIALASPAFECTFKYVYDNQLRKAVVKPEDVVYKEE